MKTFYIYCIFLLLISCKESSHLSLDSRAELHVEIPNLSDSLFWNYSDVFSNVTFIALESSPSAAIGNINNLEITPNNDFIVLDMANRKVIRFDSEGKFLNKIGDCGHGNHEYVEPLNIVYDDYNKIISVYDNARKKILNYRLDGSYISSIQLNHYIRGIQVLNKDQIIVFNNYDKGGKGFNYWIMDRQGNVLSKFEEIPQHTKLNPAPCTNYVFSKGNDYLLCRSPYSSIVYKVVQDTVKTFLHIDNSDINWANGEPRNIDLTYKKIKGKTIDFIAQIKNKLFMNVCINSYIYTYICDINQPQLALAGLVHNNNLTNINVTGHLLKANENNIYYSVDPCSFERLLHNIEKEQLNSEIDIEFLRKMSSNQNPIIEICTVKD